MQGFNKSESRATSIKSHLFKQQYFNIRIQYKKNQNIFDSNITYIAYIILLVDS